MNWPEIERLYLAAADLKPADRPAFLDRVCAQDSQLRREVESLLQADAGRHSSFLHSPPSRLAAQVLNRAGRNTSAIGSYRVIRILGEGGMGTVYEAEQLAPHRKVALKVVKAGMAGEEILRRFQQEAEALGRLQHPGIAQIYHAGTAEQGYGPQPYFAMELIEGRPILLCAEEAPLNARAKLELMAKVCDAVHHAHQRGILHRDLKPSNILVDQAGQPKILDFGVARVMDADVQATRQTDLGQLIGTLAYMSPEQAGGRTQDLDTRSDIYSLGVILYELLAGRLPYRTKGLPLHEAVRTIQEQDPAALSAIDARHRGDVEVIVEKALEKSRDRRYASAAEFGTDIRRYLADEPIAARPASAAYQLQKFARRQRTLVVSTLAVLLTLFAGVIGSTYQAVRAREAERLAKAGQALARQERDRALAAEKNAASAAATAKAVSDFLQNDLLAQASTRSQEGPSARVDPDLTVRAALDRAASRLSGKFDKEPEVEAAIRLTITNTYLDRGLYQDARLNLQRALVLRRQIFGDDDPRTLQLQTRMATLLRFSGLLAESEALYKKTIQTQRRVLPARDADLLIAQSGLANTYFAEGQFAEAAALGEEVLTIRRTLASPDTRKSLQDLAGYYQALGEFAKAERTIREVWQANLREYGPEGLSTLANVNLLALTLASQGKTREAGNLLRHSLAIKLRVLGPNHPSTLEAMHNLAACADQTGRHAQAEALLRKTLARERKVLGPEHQITLKTMHSLAQNLLVQAKYAESEQLFRHTWEIRRRLLGPESAFTMNSAAGLARAFLTEGNFAASEPLARQVMETDRKRRPDGWERFLAESLLGAALLGQKKFAEAEPHLLAGLRGMEARKDKIDAAERDRLAGARTWLVQFYRESGRPQPPKTWATGTTK